MNNTYLILFFFLFTSLLSQSQDVIEKYDGKKIECIIIDIEEDVVVFLPYNKQEGPNYELDKLEIKIIHYENGESLEFKVKAIQTEPIFGEKLYYSTGFWGLNVYQGGYKLSRSELKMIYKNASESLHDYTKGANNILIGNLIAIPGAFALGWGIGSLIIGSDVNIPLITIGAVGTLTGVLIIVSGNKAIKRSVNSYNSGLESIIDAKLELRQTQNGVGLIYSF